MIRVYLIRLAAVTLMVAICMFMFRMSGAADKADADHMAFGVSACGQQVLWVFTLQDGHIRRYDKDHGPSTPAAKAAFQDWLEQGPTDVVEIPCKPVTSL